MPIGSNGQAGGVAISKLGCAFAPARGRGRRFRLLVAAAREGKAVTAAAGVEASPLEVGGLGRVSSCVRPSGCLTLAVCPPVCPWREPSRSTPEGDRRGGGAGPSTTGRRGEGVPSRSLPRRPTARLEGLLGRAGAGIFGARRQRGYARGTVGSKPDRRGSPLLQVCGVPTPPPPWPGLSGACGEGSPFPLALRRARNPRPSSQRARDPPAAATRSPGPSDLGCPGGWASAPPAAPQVSATFHGTSFSGVAVKFTTGVLAEKQKLTPSQTFLPFGPS